MEENIKEYGNMMLQARMAEAVNLNMGDTIAFLVKENSENTVMIQPLASDMQAMKDQLKIKCFSGTCSAIKCARL